MQAMKSLERGMEMKALPPGGPGFLEKEKARLMDIQRQAMTLEMLLTAYLDLGKGDCQGMFWWMAEVFKQLKEMHAEVEKLKPQLLWKCRELPMAIMALGKLESARWQCCLAWKEWRGE